MTEDKNKKENAKGTEKPINPLPVRTDWSRFWREQKNFFESSAIDNTFSGLHFIEPESNKDTPLDKYYPGKQI